MPSKRNVPVRLCEFSIRIGPTTGHETEPKQVSPLEMKASAYVQSWRTARPSKINFGVGKRLEMDDLTAAYGTVPARIADVSVFALFEPQTHPAGDILDTGLWRFHVVDTSALEARIGHAKSASLATIQAFGPCVRLHELRSAIDRAIAASPAPRSGSTG